jgi:cytochrome c556
MLTVSAQNQPTPEQQAATAVNARKSVVRLFAFNMGPISGMARGTVEFDGALAERNARRIAAMAPMLVETFAAMDTRPYTVETEALPIIWDRFDEFQQKADALVQGANTFADIAARGNREETIAAVRAFGSNCGGCHDVFRLQD